MWIEDSGARLALSPGLKLNQSLLAFGAAEAAAFQIGERQGFSGKIWQKRKKREGKCFPLALICLYAAELCSLRRDIAGFAEKRFGGARGLGCFAECSGGGNAVWERGYESDLGCLRGGCGWLGPDSGGFGCAAVGADG
jgi:hypothetical protein